MRDVRASSGYLKRRAMNSCPSDDHHYSSSHAAIAAESSQHNLNLLVSDSSVTTTTVVTARNINVHIVAFLEMANRLEASTNIWRRRAHSRHLISLYRSTGARPSWGDDNERDDESNNVVPTRQTTRISSPDDSDDDDLDGDTERADNGDPTDVKRARRAEHSTLLGRLGDMNQKYDAAAIDNRVLRADIETREQKWQKNSEKSDRSEPFAVGKTKHGHTSEQHTKNPKYYWYRFITKSE
ncbi:unnamed protein product [Brassica rapa subsp. trilocularis]